MGSLNQIGECCFRLGAAKVFLVADRGIIDCGWVGESPPYLENSRLHNTWSNFSANPRDFEVEKGALLYSEEDAMRLAIGGGSAIDAAKAVATLASNGGRIQEYEGIDLITKPLPPIIAVPSTAGSGSEVSQFSIIADSKRKIKMTIISKSLVPDIAISDPIILSTVNSRLTAHTGMEALSHAIEAFVSLASTDLTDVHALHAIKLIAGNLRASVASQVNEGAKVAMAKASLQAGLAFSNAVLGLAHAMSHQVGGLLDLPIGETSAILLPAVMRFNLISSIDKFAEVCRAMGIKDNQMTNRQAAEKTIDMVQQLAEDVGIPPGLSQLGLSEEVIPELSRNAIKDACFITNPRDATVEDIMEIFHRAF